MQANLSVPRARQRSTVSPLAAELAAIFEVIDDEALLGVLARYRWNGRPGWSLRALWRAYLSGFVLALPTVNALVRRLQDDPALREVCGFGGDLPSRWTFGRFVSRLSHHTDAVESILAVLTGRLHDLLPGFGQGVAVDASTVRSWSNPDRKVPSDPEASWTAKDGNHGGRKQWFWGYKLHLAVDAKYELPVAMTFTTAKAGDVTQYQPLLEHARAMNPWLKSMYVVADRGYDAKHAYEYTVDKMRAVPIILNREMRRVTSGIELDDGTPTCLSGQPMTFIGYTDEGKLRYRCATGGCELKERLGVIYCDTYLEIDPREDLRRFALIPRRSKEWRSLYETRQSVERVFSRLKSHRALNSHCRRGLRKVSLHALMAVLSVQASAVAHAIAGDSSQLRAVSRRVA
jgi:hypothetical protein